MLRGFRTTPRHVTLNQPPGSPGVTMSLSMHQASAPVFMRALKGLSTVLRKAAAHAETKGFDPVALLQARLYPDMFPLSRQVQICTDFAKGAVARLAGEEPP